MGALILHNEVRLATDPGDAFSRFGTGDPRAGWLFGSEAGSIRPGSLLRLAIPLGGLDGIEGTARVVSVSPFRQIELLNETPWSGRVTCQFSPDRRGGTKVTMRVAVDDREVERLGAELGLVSSAAPPGSITVGLLTSLSGSAGLLGRSTVNCAELAVEEINANGGVLGRPVHLLVADDATDVTVGTLAMRRLLDTPTLSTVVGMHSSATYRATAPMAVAAGVPYLYTPTSEPQGGHPLLVQFGETPAEQLCWALPRLAEETGGSRWFFVGNDYSWPRAISGAARSVVERMGAAVVGEGYLPLGATEFEPLLAAIQGSGADHVISSFVGQDHVRFERDFVRFGLRESTRTFAPLLDDAVVEHLGADADGIWNVLGYFQGLDSAANRAFLSRYRERFGSWSAPVSAAAEGVYEAMHHWALACHSGRGSDAVAVVDGLRRVRFRGPRPHGPGGGRRLLLGEAGGGGVQILDDLPGRSIAS